MPLDKKYIVIITSAGRTGTTFLGDNLSKIIDDCFSIHQPDVISFSWKKNIKSIKCFGLYHMVFGRLISRTGIRNIYQKYLEKKISKKQTEELIIKHRKNYYRRQEKKLIVESNSQWFSLLPIFQETFPNSKSIGIMRDPRDWLTSWHNYRGMHYTKKDLVSLMGYQRLEPKVVNDKKFINEWELMSDFEKNCWHWQFVAKFYVQYNKTLPNFKVFKYEDLFIAEDKEFFFNEMLEFITAHSNKKFLFNFDDKIFDKKINSSLKNKFPNWRDWDDQTCKSVDNICGDLMRKYEYGLEEEWLLKIND